MARHFFTGHGGHVCAKAPDEHFRVLAEETSIPQCIYNIPGRTGKNIEPETIARLAELENITMIKEATGSLDQASQIISATNLTLLSGDDSLTLPLLAVGGRGVVSRPQGELLLVLDLCR